ncbi:phage terminase large subunit family protein [Pseudomonas aeruginosa]|uniref:phage terminase large subunit family protein n=1 Tax=Pseudomonas aeruginosa TaxID=287 RepID=UPI001910189E|nr:terminase gpA endonuclease subunit [Pseudomonas aeruginosa]HCA7745364.1 phage terminase large subunit family protein [Pseudomonas aeruginosa]HCF6733745.1 phage terminase large subunit family protein [Pseudomonas aeruginosa]HDY6080033.1 phage terminase large subunit family protein [Pseudomonas aeruginosa]HEJ3399401.1 phage terminase large subunit family protein [Pseudomonas aeruginosa]HEJ5582441.1 phage terminase large subunit family protein [Pseudomonas aeruginosa]
MGQSLSSSAKMNSRRRRTTTYRRVEDIALGVAAMFNPPERLSVAEAAAKYRYLNNPGSFRGYWRNDKAPYLVEPMNELDSRFFEGVIFVGPAQSGKTDALILNWVLHSAKCDPMDMILYNPSTAAARDFSMRRIDRLHRHSPVMEELLLKKRDADNTFDKHYVNGMMLTMSWPSVVEFAGKPVPRVGLTDFDRMDMDIEGDGNPYDLAAKRTTTYGSYRMALAESSPSKPLLNPRWIRTSPHEAPPAEGILALYNRGDRRRWYWPCPHCNGYFEGTFELLEWDGKNRQGQKLDPIGASESVFMRCSHCGHPINPDWRHEMQQWGMWLKEGEGIDAKGRRFGQPRRTKIASFWLNGVAAAFTNWAELVRLCLTAEEEYASTGSEEALKKFYNTDLGVPYMPKAVDSERLPEHLHARAEELGEKVVPLGTRFLVANVDVQKNMFVVQVHGIAPGTPFDMCLVDRFQIRKSKRLDDAGDHLWVKPATYLDDWDLLIEDVMDRSYPLADGSGRRMAIKLTTCDSGGYSKDKGESVTSMAYDFYRRLKRENRHGRFHLVKGDPSPGVPRARISFPDAPKKDRHSAARGDVPVLLLNSNVLKDALHARLDCITPGHGMYRFPDWLPDWWYQEMCAEDRTAKGWLKRPHTKNEAWDLSYYCIGVCVSSLLLVEKMDWQKPPAWADEWDRNSLVSAPEEAPRFAPQKEAYDFGKFAQAMA